MKKIIIYLGICLFLCSQIVFAGQLGQNEYGFFYVQDDGSFAISKWIKLDLNSDGIEENCYFNASGLLDLNVKQNANDSTIQTKEAENSNDESVNPSMIPPKAKKAIERIRDLCLADGPIIIPHSKKAIRSYLNSAGYKRDIIDTAIDNCNIDWKEHAVVFADRCKNLKFSDIEIKDLMKIEGFSSEEIEYGLAGIHKDVSKIYINPDDYKGLTKEQKLQKLIALGLSNEKAQDALSFLDYTIKQK